MRVVFVHICHEFPGHVLSEEAKTNLAVVVNASFVTVSHCTPVSQIQAAAEWMQTRLLLHTQLLYIFISSRWLYGKLHGAFVMQRIDS